MKCGYKFVQYLESHKPQHRAFSFCWNRLVLPKVGCFVWLALKKWIWMSDRLEKLNIAHSFQCVMCNKEVETIDHLFLNFPFAQYCWFHVMNKLNLVMPIPKMLWYILQSWPTPYSNSMFACIWKCIPASIIWAIWWERNKRICFQVSLSLKMVVEGLEKSIIEIVNANILNYKGNLFFLSLG